LPDGNYDIVMAMDGMPPPPSLSSSGMPDDAPPRDLAHPPPPAAGTRPYHHTRRGFRNPPGSARDHGSLGHLWIILRFLWLTRHTPRQPEVPAGFVLPRGVVIDGIRRHRHGDSLTWLGHACFLIRLGGRTILTDPFLSSHASPIDGFGPRRFTPPALGVRDLPPLDMVLISHNHYDHFDVAALADPRFPRGARVVVPLGLGPRLIELGYIDTTEVDWHHAVALGGDGNAPVRVVATPAVHFSGRGLFDRNRTLWCGFALEGGGKRLYFGGDSAFGDVFGEVGARHGPFDLAMLGVGAYEPRPIFRKSHSTPEEAVEMARLLGARRIAGMHYGSIVLSGEPAFEPPVRLRAAARAAGYADEDIWTMRLGETRAL
jgi:L-ascorbate metabolism protein UlaG (beta-lactamase superfamily)